jgi:hypothetical protein
MTVTRRRMVALAALCLGILLAGAAVVPTRAAPAACGVSIGAGSDGVDDAIPRDGSGWHIETVDSSGDVGWDTSIAVDAWGNPHISYYDSSQGTLKYARWTGSAWHIETVDYVDRGGAGYSAWDTSIALDGAGYPHISYCYSTSSLSGALKYARWDGVTWNIETVDTAGSVGWYTSLALDSADTPHISHYQDHVYDLRYSRWGGSAWQSETVESSGMVGAHTSLAIDGQDHPHISYWDDLNKDLKYARWDGATWSIETVDSSGNVGQYTSLAVDGEDVPHISYVDRTNYNLKYAWWDGSAWQLETVDASGVVSCEAIHSPPQWGCSTSLSLGAEGHPHISYHDATNGDLEYAYWDGSGWQLETVDGADDVGQGNSLALDTGGQAHISYYDAANGDLKYASQVASLPISIYTDKASYAAGDTMRLGLDITTSPGGPLFRPYWFLLLLRTPSTGAVVVNLPALLLPSGWSYSNPEFFAWTLPYVETGSYTWVGMLIPVGDEPAMDYAGWEFTGGPASGKRVVPIHKAVKPPRGAGADLGR